MLAGNSITTVLLTKVLATMSHKSVIGNARGLRSLGRLNAKKVSLFGSRGGLDLVGRWTGSRLESSQSPIFPLLGMRPESGSPGRTYVAYPNLRKVRWLFPADNSVLRRAGVRGLFSPGSIRGGVLKKLIEVGAIRGEQVRLENEPLVRLESEFAQICGEREVRVAFYVGTAGAYRKVTAQVMTPTGRTLTYSKIGMSPPAQASVEGERRVLLRLSESEALRGKVPEVLGWFNWHGGKVIVVTSAAGRLGPRRLSGLHSQFCENAFLSFAEEYVFGEGPMWARMTETLLRLNRDFADPLPAYCGHALQLLREELGSVKLPLSLAHRDFAPWNTKLVSGDLFVFDWEHAETGVTPLYDVFHFWAIQAALFRRRRRFPDRRFLENLLHRLWPGGQQYLPWLYLAYLLDMSLTYGEAQVIAPGVGEQRVWRWFLQQVEAFLEEGSPL
jgi:hypothetical protein